MSKAYDRIEWDFVEDIMRRMGFDNRVSAYSSLPFNGVI